MSNIVISLSTVSKLSALALIAFTDSVIVVTTFDSLRKSYNCLKHRFYFSRGEFSYSKLERLRSNKPGCYILRESDLVYDQYYIDVCTENR